MKLLLRRSDTPLLFLVKAARNKVPAGQMALAWDEESHPRAAAGSHEGGHHGGEFVKKEDVGTPVENGPSYRSKFTGLEFTVTHKKEPERGGHLPVYTGTVTKQGTGGFSKFKVGDRHSASAIQIVNHYDQIGGDPLNKPEEKAEDPNVLHTFTNDEEGVKSVVARYSGKGGGFIVSLHDTDAGEPVGYGKIYTVEGEAVKQAREWAKVPEPAAETPAAAPEGAIYDDTYTGPRFTYGGQNRPLGYAAIPKGHIPGSNREHGSFRHGTVDYPRELTPEEAGGFELERVYSDSESGGMSPEQHQTAAAWIEDYKKEIPTMERGDKDMMVELYRAHKRGPAALREYLDANRATNYYADALADQLNLPRLPNLYLKKAKRSVPAGQTGFDFDAEPAAPAHSGTFKEEDHPRAPAGAGGDHHGGEFISKEEAGGAPVGGTAAEAPEAVEEESLRPTEANYKYRDTGYIPGSRKELAATQIRRMAKAGERVNPEDIDWDELETNPREAESLITKANVFGASSFDEMEERGVEPGAAFLIQKVYASVAPKPEDSPVARQNYVNGIANLRDKLEECKTVDDVMGVLEGIKDDMTGEMFTAEQQEEMARLKGESHRLFDEWKAGKAVDDGEYAQHNERVNKVRGMAWEISQRERRKWKVDPEMRERHAQAAAELARDEEAHYDRARKRRDELKALDARRRLASDKVMALKAIGVATNTVENPLCAAYHALGQTFWRVVNHRSFKGSETFLGHYANAKNGRIKDYGFAKGEKKVARANRARINFRLEVADTVERVGGRPMATDSTTGLKNTFGLRDVQSGEWVLNDPDSAKFHVENTSMALQDLADVLGMSDHETGFNGRLGLAFGARGQGLNSAAAHYERVHRVINLTKMHGAGSLAHEWWHAFDNLIHEAATGQAGKAAHYVSDNTGILPQGELRDQFSQLMQFIDKSEFKKEAEKIDKSTGRSSSYWANSNELTARAFAAFVEDNLGEQGRANTYLTAMNDNRHYHGNPFTMHADGTFFKPCPDGLERMKLNQMLEGLFHVANAEGTVRKALETLEIRLLLPVQTPPALLLKAMALCKDCHSLLTPGEARDGRCMGCREAHELSKAARGKAMPGQMAMNWDEDAHPRAPAGSEHGGEFVKREAAVATAPKPVEARAKPVILGVSDDVTTCEHCGKPNLKKTVALQFEPGTDPSHYGVDCAAAALYGKKSSGNRERVNVQATVVSYALKRMKEAGDPMKVCDEIQGRWGYACGPYRGGLEIAGIHIRKDGTVGEPVGPIKTGPPVMGVRLAVNQGDTHQPIGTTQTPERPVGSKEVVTEVPGPVLLYRTL